jgi:energy-converting hydrogenase Eha subunit F
VKIRVGELPLLNRQLARFNYSTLGDLVKGLIAALQTPISEKMNQRTMLFGIAILSLHHSAVEDIRRYSYSILNSNTGALNFHHFLIIYPATAPNMNPPPSEKTRNIYNDKLYRITCC